MATATDQYPTTSTTMQLNYQAPYDFELYPNPECYADLLPQHSHIYPNPYALDDRPYPAPTQAAVLASNPSMSRLFSTATTTQSSLDMVTPALSSPTSMPRDAASNMPHGSLKQVEAAAGLESEPLLWSMSSSSSSSSSSPVPLPAVSHEADFAGPGTPWMLNSHSIPSASTSSTVDSPASAVNQTFVITSEPWLQDTNALRLVPGIVPIDPYGSDPLVSAALTHELALVSEKGSAGFVGTFNIISYDSF